VLAFHPARHDELGEAVPMLVSRGRQHDLTIADDPWDVFELDNDLEAEPEPEYGDFWGELNDDSDNCG
jgi:hypothetical protein